MSDTYSVVLPVIEWIVADSEIEAVARLAAKLTAAGFEVYAPVNGADVVAVGALVTED